MKLKNKRDTLFFIMPLLVFASIFQMGFCSGSEEQSTKMIKTSSVLGGLRDFRGAQNNGEFENIGRFAVQQHNKNQNTILEFTRVVKAKEQVVAGKMYHLTLEAVDSGKKKLYEAKVWVKPWMNFKQLQEFKHVLDMPLFTSSHLGY